MIPLTNNNSYPLDIEETPIEVIGENDGVFNNEDYILFLWRRNRHLEHRKQDLQ